MKQYVVMIWMICILAWWSVFAQAQRTTNLGDLTLRFCNDTGAVAGTKTAVLEAIPEEEKEVCMFIENGGLTDATITLNFVDGTITADADQKKACEPESAKTNFGQYITNYPTTVQINGGETVKIAATAKFPAGYAGTAYGCATFQIVNMSGDYQWWEQTQMFTIVSRRANFIDINVLGEYVVDLQSKDAFTEGSFPWFISHEVSVVDSLLTPWHNIGEVIATQNPLSLRLGKTLTTRSVVVNSGNVWLDLTISSQYRAWFGLINLDQWSQTQKLVPKQTKTIEFATNKLAWWVGGPVTVTHTITYQPIIVGSGGIIDPALLAPQTKILTSTGFVTAWHGRQMLGWAFVIILWYLVYLINRMRRKHSHKRSRKSFN